MHPRRNHSRKKTQLNQKNKIPAHRYTFMLPPCSTPAGQCPPHLARSRRSGARKDNSHPVRRPSSINLRIHKLYPGRTILGYITYNVLRGEYRYMYYMYILHITTLPGYHLTTNFLTTLQCISLMPRCRANFTFYN